MHTIHLLAIADWLALFEIKLTLFLASFVCAYCKFTWSLRSLRLAFLALAILPVLYRRDYRSAALVVLRREH